jgi:Mrp family chromosome partitioning ATPase
MAEISLPVIVTAVADSEFEGFISGTLFSQGWNVVFRALDLPSLQSYVDTHEAELKEIVLVFSPDLPGIAPEIVQGFQRKVKQVIGFSSHNRSDEAFVGLLPRPQDATALITLVRGFVRTPLLRESVKTREVARRAKVVAIASPSGSTGCTTICINLAMELSLLGRECLVIDADVRRPAIAPLLSLHGLESETTPRIVAPKMSVSEFNRTNVEGLHDFMESVLDRFDFIIVDLGAIEGFEDSLTDRRWTSSMIHWSCDFADELWVVGKADVLGIIRIEKLVRNFLQINIRAKISLLLNMRGVGRKGADQEGAFLSATAELKPFRVFTLPKDVSSVARAEVARASLVEVNPRSLIRKAIAKLAVEVDS